MNEAASRLEATRIERAFEQLKCNWWWFNAELADQFGSNNVAWRWELLRRSAAYAKYCVKLESEKGPYDCEWPGDDGFVEDIKKLHPLGVHDPRRNWRQLHQQGCHPSLSWAVLSDQQRNSLEFHAPLFPNADVPARSAAEITINPVFVKRLRSGKEKLTPAWPNRKDQLIGGTILLSANRCTAIESKHESARVLPVGVDHLAYIVIIFDVRIGEVVAKQLKCEYQFHLERAYRDLTTFVSNQKKIAWPALRKSFSQVVPSRQLNYAQAWVAADGCTELQDIITRFASLIDSRSRRKWLPECKAAWQEPETFGQGAETPTTHWPAFEEFPSILKSKPAKAKFDLASQAGLAAFDCRNIEPRFTEKGLLIPFLKEHQEFANYSDPELLRDALKGIARLIERIDRFYSKP